MFADVEKIGEFVEDPDGDVIEVKFINPKDYKDYFDWGPVGDRLVERGLEMLD